MTDNLAPLTQTAEGGSYIAQAAHGGTAIVEVHHPPTPIQEQNRIRFLKRLRYTYRSIWEQSLHGAALLTLGLVEQPDAVLHPPGLYFQSDEQAARPLSAGTSILQVYEGTGQELLILGEPGAGKSMLLLDLARQLVQHAEQDGQQPIPVLLPLSSWAVKRPPFADWLGEQLIQLYDLPHKLSQAWVQDDHFLLLLDGLDEVSQDARVACIEAITTYRKDHLVPLVICSRRSDYEEILHPERLVLNSAVIVQPLTNKQVEDYLVQAGSHLLALRTALRTNTALQELVTTPLMLNVLALAYTDASLEDLPHGGSVEQQQRMIFDRYIECMVKRKGDLKSYPLPKTISWLGWLARQMRDHNQTVFYLEHLQPDWLTSIQCRTYLWRAVRLPAIGIGVLASIFMSSSLYAMYADLDSSLFIEWVVFGGFLGWLFSRLDLQERAVPRHQKRIPQVIERFIISLCVLLTMGILYYLLLYGPLFFSPWSYIPMAELIGLVLLLQYLPLGVSQNRLSSNRKPSQQGKRRRGLFHTIHARRVLWITLVIGIGMGLSSLVENLYFWHSDRLNHPLSQALSDALNTGLTAGLIIGLVTVLVSQMLEVQAKDIHLTERLRWTWRSLARSLFATKHLSATILLVSITWLIVGLNDLLHLGLSFGLDYALHFGLRFGLDTGFIEGLSFGLNFGLSYWVLLGLFHSISQERVEDKDRSVFNQGIRRSLRNSRIMGIIGGGVIGIIVVLGLLLRQLPFYPNLGTIIELTDVPSLGVFQAMIGGLLVWAVTGRLAVRRHAVIRRLLWRAQTFPWKAETFLNDATTRILMQRVGGGYRFIHRLLLDYFATLEETIPRSASIEHAPTTISAQPIVEQTSMEPVAEVLLEEPTAPLRMKRTQICACGYEEERPGGRFCPRCGQALI